MGITVNPSNIRYVRRKKVSKPNKPRVPSCPHIDSDDEMHETDLAEYGMVLSQYLNEEPVITRNRPTSSYTGIDRTQHQRLYSAIRNKYYNETLPNWEKTVEEEIKYEVYFSKDHYIELDYNPLVDAEI